MAKTLNDIMEFDHVVQVHADGTITEPDNVHAPEVIVDVDEDGSILGEHEAEMICSVRAQGWELLTGFTGQYGYNGPCLHSSEYIGGGLERHIRETPGLYVAVVVITSSPEGPSEADSWAVAYRAEEG